MAQDRVTRREGREPWWPAFGAGERRRDLGPKAGPPRRASLGPEVTGGFALERGPKALHEVAVALPLRQPTPGAQGQQACREWGRGDTRALVTSRATSLAPGTLQAQGPRCRGTGSHTSHGRRAHSTRSKQTARRMRGRRWPGSDYLWAIFPSAKPRLICSFSGFSVANTDHV